MKPRLIPVVMAFFLAVAARGLEKPPTAEEMLARARLNRVEYLGAILDVQRFVRTMGRPEEVYSYLLALDELDTLGKKFDVEALGGSPLHELSVALTQAAIKFIRLDSDSPEAVSAFLKWAEDGTRHAAVHEQTRHLNPISDKSALFVWHAAIRRSLTQLAALKAAAFVTDAFDELQGDVVKKLLLLRTRLTPEEKHKLVADMTSISGLQEVLDFIREEAATSKEPALLKESLGWTLTLNANLRKLNRMIPIYLRSTPGQILSDVLAAILVLGETPPIAQISAILDNMSPSQTFETAANVVSLYEHKPIPDAQLDFLFELTGQLINRLGSLGQAGKVMGLSKLRQRVGFLRIGQ